MKIDLIHLKNIYVNLDRKIKFQHPSYFDEYKHYQNEMFPDDTRTYKELKEDYFKMALKVQIRQDSKCSFLTYEEIEKIKEELIENC